MIYLRAFVITGIFIVIGVTGWVFFKEKYSSSQRPHTTIDQMEQEGVPTFALKDINGKEYSLEQFRGKIIILNFWASWCDPCIEEFPSMIRLINDLNGEVVMLAVSADEAREDIDNFVSAFGAKSEYLYILWDQKRKVAEQYGTYRLPETYIVDRDLKLFRKVVGQANWHTPETLEFFKDLINFKK